MRLAAVILFSLASSPAFGAEGGSEMVMWVVLGAVGPLLAVTATAFAKASVLLGILRGGLGAHALPLPVLTGLAAALTLVVMAPVGRQIIAEVGVDGQHPMDWVQTAERGWPVLDRFLGEHTRPEDRALVQTVSAQLHARAHVAPPAIQPEVNVLAFLVSELGAAFQLGIMLLLPFLIVDLLVANTLTTIGFALVPPALIALPFKLLLFIAADGWTLFVRGFAGSYLG